MIYVIVALSLIALWAVVATTVTTVRDGYRPLPTRADAPTARRARESESGSTPEQRGSARVGGPVLRVG
jgi:hypothetical protein